MYYFGDYCALALVAILSLFYFPDRRFLTRTSKLFAMCLVFIAANALLDLLTGCHQHWIGSPIWVGYLVNSAYFLCNLLTTSCIAQYLALKILEHVYGEHCIRQMRILLSIIFWPFVVIVLLNLWNGWLFYFDQQGHYRRGPLNAVGYAAVLMQMACVTACYLRNRKQVDRSLSHALLQTFPVGVLCIVLQRLYVDIMLNSFLLSLVALVMFLNFQGPRPGVHSLTKLNDRIRFFKSVKVQIATGKPFQVLLIQVRHFSEINRRFGYLAADEILYQFAFSLERQFPQASAFHMNGTEFTLILPSATEISSQANARILLDFLDGGIFCLHQQVHLSYNVVDYLSSSQDHKAGELYEKMAYALRLARQQNLPYLRYTQNIGAQMLRRQYLADRLQTIDQEHGYEVWLQPVFCCKNQRFCSAESLIRLREPDGQLISPEEFIPLAEETGQIFQLTWFVVEQVCRLLQDPRMDSLSAVSINVPAQQMMATGFLDNLNRIADGCGIYRNRICLEFTERSIPGDFSTAQKIMEQIAGAGYRFYLDDFGTGYSNFNLLLQLPFFGIKLDKSVTASDSGRADMALIGELTHLFHRRNLQVIAEGVETETQAQALLAEGVDRLQGYFYARPMPPEKALEFYGKQ